MFNAAFLYTFFQVMHHKADKELCCSSWEYSPPRPDLVPGRGYPRLANYGGLPHAAGQWVLSIEEGVLPS